MKKLFLSLLSLLFALSAVAQVGEYRSQLSLGVSGGWLMNKVFFTPGVKQNYHGGATGGLTLRYTSERYFNVLCAVQAEVNYAQMGWRELIETSTDTYSRTMHYVQVPLLARLSYGKEERGVMGYLVLGPQLGFFLSDKEKKGGEWSEETLGKRPNGVIGQYGMAVDKKFEYGLTGGLGSEFNTRVGHFMVEGRYYYALGDMFNNGKADYFARSANGTIIAKASYLFDVKRKKKQR